MRCIICKKKSLKVNEDLPLFTHHKFYTLSKKVSFNKCTSCQIIFNRNKIKNIFFHSKKYFLENRQEHKIFSKGKFINRSFFVAKLILKTLKIRKNLKVVDIGCFNGNLLNNLSQSLVKSTFVGFEKNNFCKKIFPKKKNFVFIKNEIQNIPKNFDAIIFSHSIFYFENLKETISIVSSRLKENGKIFIVIPDINKNPFYSLMGDQKAIFTKINIINVFKFFGIRLKVIKQNYLKNEIILYGRKVNKKSNRFKKDIIFLKAIKKIKTIKNKIEKRNFINPVIFGTKVTAAALDEFLKKKTLFFIDHNKSKYISSFRGKNIILPKNLKKKVSIISSFSVPRKVKSFFIKNKNLKIQDYERA